MKPTPLLLTCLIGLAVPMAGLAQPTIQFSAISYTVVESAGQAGLTVQRAANLATPTGSATHRFKHFSRTRAG